MQTGTENLSYKYKIKKENLVQEKKGVQKQLYVFDVRIDTWSKSIDKALTFTVKEKICLKTKNLLPEGSEWYCCQSAINTYVSVI